MKGGERWKTHSKGPGGGIEPAAAAGGLSPAQSGELPGAYRPIFTL